jgi:hypothetical protein
MDFDITSDSAAIEEALRQSRGQTKEAREARKASYKAKREARKQSGRNKKSKQHPSDATSDVIMSSTSGINKQQNPQGTRRCGGKFYRATAPIFDREAEMQDMTTEGAMNVAGDGEGAEGEPKTAEATPAKKQSRKARAAAKREARKLKMSMRMGSGTTSSTTGVFNENEKPKETAQTMSNKPKKRVTGWSVVNDVHIADGVEVEQELELTFEDANAILAARNTPEAEAIALARGLSIPPRPDKAMIAQARAAALATREANRLKGSINNLLAKALSRVDLSSTPKVKKSSTVGITKKQREPTKREKRAMAAEAKKKAESDKKVDKREQALLDAAEALIAKVDKEREQTEKGKLVQKAQRSRTRGIKGENLDEEVAALEAEQAEYARKIDNLREESREEARQTYEKAAVENGEATEVDDLAKLLDLVEMGRKHNN